MKAMKKSIGKTLFNRSSRKKADGSCSSPLSRQGSSQPESRSESACSSEGVEQDISELEEVFRKFDANGDGMISATELADLMRSMGSQVAEEELQVMMREADVDGDGFISLQEFVDLNTKGACVKDLKNAFKMFDLDRNGFISADELYQVLRSMGEGSTREECRNIIHSVDRNSDGLVNFEEFKNMMTNKISNNK